MFTPIGIHLFEMSTFNRFLIFNMIKYVWNILGHQNKWLNVISTIKYLDFIKEYVYMITFSHT